MKSTATDTATSNSTSVWRLCLRRFSATGILSGLAINRLIVAQMNLCCLLIRPRSPNLLSTGHSQ